MIRTRVGYTGGEKKSPTYRSLGQHSEAIQVTYDPEVVSYADLLDVFWDSHTPTHEPFSRQYRSAVFVATKSERQAAEASLQARQRELGERVYTAIEPAVPFWSAEDYHQKHSLRGDAVLLAAVVERFPDESWVDSTAAARLNALAGGYRWAGDLDQLGLTGEARARAEALLRDR